MPWYRQDSPFFTGVEPGLRLSKLSFTDYSQLQPRFRNRIIDIRGVMIRAFSLLLDPSLPSRSMDNIQPYLTHMWVLSGK